MSTQPTFGRIGVLGGLFAFFLILLLAAASGQLEAGESDSPSDTGPPEGRPPDFTPPPDAPPVDGPPISGPPDLEPPPGDAPPQFDSPPGQRPPVTPPVSVPARGRRIDLSNLPALGGLGRGFERIFVEIPPGAIVREIALKIGKPDHIPPGKAALQAVEFTIEGHQGRFNFAEPVTIGIPLPEELIDNEAALTVLHWDPAREDWVPLTLLQSIVADRAQGIIAAQVTHFSVYGVHYAEEQVPTAVQHESWGQVKSLGR